MACRYELVTPGRFGNGHLGPVWVERLELTTRLAGSPEHVGYAVSGSDRSESTRGRGWVLPAGTC